MAKCEITVSVDTKKLIENDDVADAVTLSGCDGKDKEPGKSNTFETKVNGNTKIVWIPNTNSIDAITISNIAVTSNANVFQYGVSPSGPNNEGQWEGQVKNNKDNPGVLSEYRIYFQVNGVGKTYKLDPKIEVNPNT